MTCQYCGLDPYEYVDVGVGFVPVAVNCCERGIMMYGQGMEPAEIENYMRSVFFLFEMQHIKFGSIDERSSDEHEDNAF